MHTHLTTKNEAVIRATVGREDMKNEEVTENILTIYNALIHALPQEKNNLKSLYIKFSMGPIVEITEKGPVVKQKQEKQIKGEKKI